MSVIVDCINSMEESLENYEIYNPIGKGGFARVYKARCKATDQEVAIKMIDKRVMTEQGMTERVKQEVRIHSRLKHPNILKLFSCFEDESYVYLVLELCHNGTLQAFLKHRQMPFAECEARCYLQQILKGIIYLHSSNIIHRDLTLANVLLTKDMSIKIGDFGLAAEVKGPVDNHLTLCGTPNYIAPEVATRSKHGQKADVWGVGVMLYTMLTGSPPFDTVGIRSTLTKVVMDDCKLPEHLSPEAKDLISSLLKKNPQERMQLEDIIAHPFLTQATEESNDSGTGSLDSGVETNALRPQVRYSGRREQQHSSSPAIAQLRTKINPLPPMIASPRFMDSKQDRMSSTPSCACCQDKHSSSTDSAYNKSSVSYEKHTLPYNRPSPSYEKPLTPGVSATDFGRTMYDKQSIPGYLNIDASAMICHKCSNPSTQHRSWCEMKNIEDYQMKVNHGSWWLNSFKTKSYGNLKDADSYEDTSNWESNLYRHQKFACSDPQLSGCSHSEPRCNGCSHMDTCHCRSNSHHMSSCSCERRSVVKEKCSNCESKRSGGSTKYQNEEQVLPMVLNSLREKPDGESKSLKNLVGPLCTLRLKPTRQRSRNCIVNILPSGEVCLEFIKKKQGEDRVSEVCRITSDGQRIVLYRPNMSKGVPVGTEPPPIPPGGAQGIYSYETLPEKHWNKYVYADRMVKLAKASTPKITLYTQQARCMLMENDPNPDFEAKFYSGSRICGSQSGVVITGKDGKPQVYREEHLEDSLSAPLRSLYRHYLECKTYCRKVEKALSEIGGSFPRFPLIIGHRPPSAPTPTQSPRERKDASSTSLPSQPIFSSFSGSILSVGSSSSPNSGRNPEGVTGFTHQDKRQDVRAGRSQEWRYSPVSEHHYTGGGDRARTTDYVYPANTRTPPEIREGLIALPTAIRKLSKDRSPIT